MPYAPEDLTTVSKFDWEQCRLQSWAALEHLKDLKLIKSIGVSNWDIPKMERLKKLHRAKRTKNDTTLDVCAS